MRAKFLRSRTSIQRRLGYVLGAVTILVWVLCFPSRSDLGTMLEYDTNGGCSLETGVGLLSLILSTSTSALLFRLLFIFVDEKISSGKTDINCFFEKYIKDQKNLFLVAGTILLLNILFFCYRFKKKVFVDPVPGYGIWSFAIETLNFTFVVFCVALLLAALCTMFDYDDAEICESQNAENSIGALWAFGAWNSYYEIIFPDLVKRMKKFEEENKLKLLVQKLVLICNLSCDVKGELCSKDGSISHKGNLEVLEIDQGANVNRRYKHSVYCIDQQSNSYVVAEYASPLGTLYNTRNVMNEDIWRYHRECFLKNLKEFVKNQPCIILEYDDENSAIPLSEFLLSSISDHLNERKFIDVHK